MRTPSKTELSEIQALITGMPKYCASTSFVLAGQTYTSSALVQIATSLLAADSAKILAKAAYKAATAAEQKLFATDGLVIQELRQNIVLIFSNSPTTMADLQIAPRKTPKPLSSEALAAKAAKTRATREARGTTSKKDKAKLSGNVTGVNITPVVAGSASSAATPAPVAPPSAPTVSATPTASSSAGAGTGTVAHG
jgi:hypothetical protein